MKFNRESMSYSDFLGLLEDKFGVHRVGFSEPRSEAIMLGSMSNSQLIPRTNEYPKIYAFEDIKGKSYILVRGDSDNKTKIFSIINDASETLTEHLNALQKFRGLDLCEWYVLISLCANMPQGDTYRVLSRYGLSDCIPEALDSDTNVSIWVEYDYKDKFLSGYLMGCDANHLIYANKQEAADKINSFANNTYTLSVGEQSRPNYIVVTQ